MSGRDKKNFVGLRIGRGGGFDLLAKLGDVAYNTDENFGHGLIGNHVRRASAAQNADVERAGTEYVIDGQRQSGRVPGHSRSFSMADSPSSGYAE